MRLCGLPAADWQHALVKRLVVAAFTEPPQIAGRVPDERRHLQLLAIDALPHAPRPAGGGFVISSWHHRGRGLPPADQFAVVPPGEPDVIHRHRRRIADPDPARLADRQRSHGRPSDCQPLLYEPGRRRRRCDLMPDEYLADERLAALAVFALAL